LTGQRTAFQKQFKSHSGHFPFRVGAEKEAEEEKKLVSKPPVTRSSQSAELRDSSSKVSRNFFVDSCCNAMASRNVRTGCGNNAGSDSSDEEELVMINNSGAKPKPPKINYGDRMPFRQGNEGRVLCR
jgi:hypothetical protein